MRIPGMVKNKVARQKNREVKITIFFQVPQPMTTRLQTSKVFQVPWPYIGEELGFFPSPKAYIGGRARTFPKSLGQSDVTWVRRVS